MGTRIESTCRTGAHLRKKRMLEPYAFLLPAMLLLLLTFGVPLINSFIIAFQRYKLGSKSIYFNGIENFINLFHDRDFAMILKNTFIYVFTSLAGQFIFGFILALALWKPFKGRGIYQSIVFLPWAFSAFVVALIFRWSFNGEYGVVNYILTNLHIITAKIAWIGTPGYSLAVVIAATIWMGIPFFAIMILAALQSISNDLLEAASIDGAGVLAKFFRITIPGIKPTLVMTLLMRTIWILNSIDIIVVATDGGPANHSMTLTSYMYSRAFGGHDFGLACAIGVLLMLFLVIYTLIYMRVCGFNDKG